MLAKVECGIGEEHHAEARNEPVGADAGEIVRARVDAAKLDIEAGGRGALARPAQHHLGDVDAEHGAFRPGFLRSLQRRVAAAAADIEHALAGRDVGGLEQQRGDWGEHAVLDVLPLGPLLAGVPIPVGRLIGVGGIDRFRHAGVASGLPFSTT